MALQTFAGAQIAVGDSTPILPPVADGTYSQWTPATGTTHYTLVADSPTSCSDTANGYVSTNTNPNRDSYLIDLSGIPNGSTMTRVDITVCYRAATTAGGTFQTMVHLGTQDTDSGSNLTGPSPVGTLATSTQNITITSTVKSSSP